MAKVSLIDKAIENLEAEIRVLTLAVEKLRDQQQVKVLRRKLRAVKPKAAQEA